MAFIGVDLHTNSFTICRRHDDGSEAFETFTLSSSAVQGFCLSLDADDEIAVEGEGRPCGTSAIIEGFRQALAAFAAARNAAWLRRRHGRETPDQVRAGKKTLEPTPAMGVKMAA
jgi:hypothetical protein